MREQSVVGSVESVDLRSPAEKQADAFFTNLKESLPRAIKRYKNNRLMGYALSFVLASSCLVSFVGAVLIPTTATIVSCVAVFLASFYLSNKFLLSNSGLFNGWIDNYERLNNCINAAKMDKKAFHKYMDIAIMGAMLTKDLDMFSQLLRAAPEMLLKNMHKEVNNFQRKGNFNLSTELYMYVFSYLEDMRLPCLEEMRSPSKGDSSSFEYNRWLRAVSFNFLGTLANKREEDSDAGVMETLTAPMLYLLSLAMPDYRDTLFCPCSSNMNISRLYYRNLATILPKNISAVCEIIYVEDLKYLENIINFLLLEKPSGTNNRLFFYGVVTSADVKVSVFFDILEKLHDHYSNHPSDITIDIKEVLINLHKRHCEEFLGKKGFLDEILIGRIVNSYKQAKELNLHDLASDIKGYATSTGNEELMSAIRQHLPEPVSPTAPEGATSWSSSGHGVAKDDTCYPHSSSVRRR